MVSLEIVKSIQAIFMSNDVEMWNEEEGKGC